MSRPLNEEPSVGLLGLPHDVLCCVLERLDGNEICRLAQTCKGLRIFCREAPLWMTVATKQSQRLLIWKDSWFRTAVNAMM